MTFPGFGVGLAIALALVYSSAAAASQPSPAGADSAEKLFQAGKFPEAAEVYSRILAHNSQDYTAIVQLGRIALLSNRLTDAQKWFQKALALQPGDTDTKVMLAEAFYRGDDFEKAAETLDGIDVSTNQLIISQYPTLNTAKIASFKGQTPYELHGNGESTPALKRSWRETHRWLHRDKSALPFSSACEALGTQKNREWIRLRPSSVAGRNRLTLSQAVRYEELSFPRFTGSGQMVP